MGENNYNPNRYANAASQFGMIFGFFFCLTFLEKMGFPPANRIIFSVIGMLIFMAITRLIGKWLDYLMRPKE